VSPIDVEIDQLENTNDIDSNKDINNYAINVDNILNSDIKQVVENDKEEIIESRPVSALSNVSKKEKKPKRSSKFGKQIKGLGTKEISDKDQKSLDDVPIE
jgi:hypothetical protein